MLSITSFLLFASINYYTGYAARLAPRQGPVELWGACNFPSQGVNGPLPCAEGSCICKDDTYAQCRTQVDGSWTPPDIGASWQCKNPGDSPSGTPSSSSGVSPAAGSGTNMTSGTSNAGTPNAGTSASTGSTSTTGNTGNGGGASSGTGTDTENPATSSATPNTGSTGGISSQTKGSKSKQSANNMQSNNFAKLAPGADKLSAQSDGDTAAAGTGGSTTPAAGGSQTPMVGGCGSTSAPGGWDGVASTSYYGWMGSACNCGQSSWQWTSPSPGLYSGAVNQKLFQGSLNGGGQPNCGQSCGKCYELSTSGYNAYDNGVGSGSTITIQVVDACFSNGDHWCGSTSDDYKDSSDCGVHFDIQTGAPGQGGVPAVGADGTAWGGGGQIVYYRETGCPSSLSGGYTSDCKCN